MAHLLWNECIFKSYSIPSSLPVTTTTTTSMIGELNSIKTAAIGLIVNCREAVKIQIYSIENQIFFVILKNIPSFRAVKFVSPTIASFYMVYICCNCDSDQIYTWKSRLYRESPKALKSEATEKWNSQIMAGCERLSLMQIVFATPNPVAFIKLFKLSFQSKARSTWYRTIFVY